MTRRPKHLHEHTLMVFKRALYNNDACNPSLQMTFPFKVIKVSVITKSREVALHNFQLYANSPGIPIPTHAASQKMSHNACAWFMTNAMAALCSPRIHPTHHG